jgi:cell division protein FtsI/penicillin-binding protein 2
MVRMRTSTVVGVVVAGAVLGGAAGGGLWWRHTQEEREADQLSRAEVNAFAQAWEQRSFDNPALRFAGNTSQEVGQAFATATSGLGSGPVDVTVEDFSRAGTRGTASFDVTWTLPDDVRWTYRVPVEVGQTEAGWTVQPPATGSYWHPQLAAGDTLKATREPGARGDLLDRSGQALMPIGKVYPVQLDPTRATPSTARALEKLVGEPTGSLVAKLEAARKAKSHAPIPVITYRESDFDRKRDELDALKGVIYPARDQPLGPTRTFGQPLLGSYGYVTAEVVAKSKGRYAAGDLAGLSGLQGQYDTVLGGTPGVRVTSSAKPDSPLFEKAAVDGSDVQTTLDPQVQYAAEEALTGTGKVPSALVAVDVKSGDVLASANSPAQGFDRAITGRYPPGSAFKIATTYSLLSGGKVTPSTKVSCPKTVTVDGRSYKNYEGESLGSPDFATDFVHSCNTAFVQLAEQLADGDLAVAAKELGVGAAWAKTLGVNGAFDGSVPANNGATDKASASIGQGRNLASPLSLAVMAGSVARGSLIPPALVTAPEPANTDRSPQPLDATVVGQLQDLMGRVVTEGTGTALKGTPGGVVHGKSGTAEFGQANPPETHAWFVGYQGDVAFAVLVEKGKSGGTVAAPIAKAFLTNLAGS